MNRADNCSFHRPLSDRQTQGGPKIKQHLKIFLRNNVSLQLYETVRRSYHEPRTAHRIRKFLSLVFADNLTALAAIHGSDKWGSHWYTSHYEEHFRTLRKKKLKILEIGVGGYDNPNIGGASLRMWKYYFPKSTIYSIDIYDKSLIQEHRIKIFQVVKLINSYFLKL